MEEILSVNIITEENLPKLKLENENTILTSVPGSSVEFEVGKVIVVQTIKTTDLFDASFTCTRGNSWLATRKEFDEKFIIVDDENKTEDFAIIIRK